MSARDGTVALDRGGCSQDWLHNTPVYSVRVSFTSEFTKIKINEGLLVAFVNQFQFLHPHEKLTVGFIEFKPIYESHS